MASPEDQASKQQRPYLFLFDGEAQNVEEPALSTFTKALLTAISVADPHGTLVAELRGGLPLLSEFAEQISEVSSEPRRSTSGVKKSHNMALYRLLLWDMSETLSEGNGAPDARSIFDVLRIKREECLVVSDMPEEMRGACDARLRECPGYVGSCAIDPGNPVQRRAFYEGLMHLALITDGSVIQQRSVDGDEYCELEGARHFVPNGLKWTGERYGAMPEQFRLEDAPLSTRGALSVDRINRKTHVTVEGRVLSALVKASWADRQGQSYRFAAAESDQDILQAVLPDGKFTDYLFNRNHPKGGPKARFIIDQLDFIPDDWRYLAAQFYDGLLISGPRDLRIERWDGGYGARFNCLINVTSRTGKSGILRTGWMLEPHKLPRLATAIPDREDDTVVSPPAPPVLRPELKGDERWSALLALCHEHGHAAHETTLPTPMILTNYNVIEDGQCGVAHVHIADARRGFARWLVRSGHGNRGYKGGASVSCRVRSQSLERAKAYAKAFARVLAFNGVPCSVRTHYT